MKPKLTITITGKPATGKTQLINHLCRLLLEHPFEPKGVEQKPELKIVEKLSR